MKEYDVLEFSNNKGITLVALIIIVIVMIIIASVSISSALDSVNDTMLEGFYTQLDLVQKRVDDIATTNEKYINDSDETIEIKNTGKLLTQEQEQKLNNILAKAQITDINIEKFKYFTIQDIEAFLDLKEIDYNLFINFDNRIVVAENGIKIDNDDYYMLDNAKSFIKHNEEKNVGKIDYLDYSDPIEYGEGTYKVIITPGNSVGDLDKTGYIRYKKSTSKYWETTNENYIIMELDVVYNVIFTDLNKNSIEKTMRVEYQKDEKENFIINSSGNKIPIIKVDIKESEEV